MSSRLFDDQDAFEPASRGARADEGYLFAGEPWEQTASEPEGPHGAHRNADTDEQPRRRRRPVPAQGAHAARYAPSWDEREGYGDSGELPELDEPERRSRPRPTQARTGQTRSGRRAAAQRARMRRRRSLVLLLALIAMAAVGFDLARGSRGVILTGDPAGQPSLQASMPEPIVASSPPSQPEAAAIQPTVRPAPVAVPAKGAGTFVYAGGTSKVFGTAGTLRRYQVVVEKGTDQDAAAFATTVDATLSDARSWIAGGKVRFQRVPQGQAHDFVIYLATEVTSEKMCAVGGLQTERYTSCRLPGQVILNLTRWLTAVPDYGAPTALYQQYVVNHEVGHQLELGHEACGGKGQLAPVMQQQTLGLKGCKANAWPFVNGSRFSGAAVA
ncbi:hypothetical protein F4553_004759 [Allocatelliglobosispora scoriae]|uniref:DUF3152 domain-containing protein n=1 Tax=Allocatelliglobosispora scoriae TaxID=643052 RepID=A0A841BXD8_9ACTN|nr:DUF3152 domain-containing protein [Allocatelliglobosispora scoriae]MBB5871380.1 hypothetical protein [Allocatelliglobosispora scoriae]